MTCAGCHVSRLAKGAGTSYVERKNDQRTDSQFFLQQKRIYSRAPNATTVVLGEPNRPGSTPSSWPLTIPFSSGLRGAFSQKGVDGTTPLMFSALRGCLRYATALLIKACSLLIPGSLAKSTIASALSCCAHASAPARSALIPFVPASTTQGSLFGSRGPPLALHRSCQLWATCPRSV
jgi:hypothetical protein